MVLERPLPCRDFVVAAGKNNGSEGISGAEVIDELYALANGPDQLQFSYSGFVSNGVKFLIKSRDDRRKTQNSGVFVPGEAEGVGHDYFGVVDDVIQLQFMNKYQVVLFKCKWFDTRRERNNKNVLYDKHFMSVDTSKEWFKEDPFIFAAQASQVYYIRDPTKTNNSWYVIEHFSHRHVWDVPEIETNDGTTGDKPISYTLQINGSIDLENLRTNRDDDVDFVCNVADDIEVDEDSLLDDDVEEEEEEQDEDDEDEKEDEDVDLSDDEAD